MGLHPRFHCFRYLWLPLLASTLLGQSAALVGSYTFQNTLNSSLATAPALTASDPLGRNAYVTEMVLGQMRSVYQFSGTAAEQAGLSFSAGNVLNPLSYSFDMVFALTERSGTWRRIFDTLDRTSDRGFYLNPQNRFDFSRLRTGTAAYEAGNYVHLTMSVGANRARVYVNGVLDIDLSTNSMNIDNPRRILHFFLDNTSDTSRTDYSSGKIALLRLYTNELSAEEAARIARDPFNSSVGLSAPSFLSNGVRNGATFAEATPIAPGAFFTVFGSSLSSGSGDWSVGFVEGQAPRRLNGTRVLVNGQEAFPVFTSPGQVNALAPDGVAPGNVSVVVERDGVASPAVTVAARGLNPSFFTYDQRNRRFIAALSADNTAYIAPADLFGVTSLNGLAVRPARPGEFVIAYGMGMGATNPFVPAGRIPAPREGGYPVAGAVQLRFGTRSVTPLYVGLSSFAGVYLVGFQVPDLPTGDYELQVTISGVSSPTGVVIPVVP